MRILLFGCFFTLAIVWSSCKLYTEDRSHLNAMKISDTLLKANQQTIMFYNVENLFDTKDDRLTDDDDFTPKGYKKWTPYNLDEKLSNLAQVIAKVDEHLPIMVGLAEVENDAVLEKLVGQSILKDAHYQFIHEDSDDERGVDVAFLYNPSYFKYISHQVISFFFLRPDGSPDYTRDILYVRGSFYNDDDCHIFINHWPSRREGKKKSSNKRIKAAQELKQKVQELLDENADAKILIMGDFNDEPYNESIEQVLINVNNQKLTNLFYRHYIDGQGTINYQNKWMQFDQMLVSKAFLEGSGLLIDQQSAKNYAEKWIMYRNHKGIYKPNKSYSGKKYHGGFSDHLPILVRTR